MNNIILDELELNFNSIEKEIFEVVCKIGLSRIKVIMEDDALSLNLIGRTSENLIEKIIDNAIDNSYRKSADKIEESTLTKISHQTIKNKVDYLGNAIEKVENNRIAKYLKGELKGKKEVSVLFEEKDGVYLKIQDEKRKHELKVGKIYEGWVKESDKYRTIGTIYFSGYEEGNNFDNLINSRISELYNEDKIQYIVLNGDGASWISDETKNDTQKIYQLDLFHIFQKANRKIKNEESRKIVKKLLREKKYDNVLEKIKEFINLETDEKKKKNCRRYIVTTRVILMHLQDIMIERILLYRRHLMV